MDQISGVGRFSGRIKKSSRSIADKNFPEFQNVGREDRLCFEQHDPDLPLQEEVLSRGTESSKRGSVSSRMTDRVHDQRLLSSH